ncbi:uncharacterized protein F5Z01DRAFT_649367 [Emericellopsis atlantica]|uniref:Uncharacterized protein n=1 Tax=Emericellopsis atlantica TaxID=2614577 RepID=A0A9P7ZRE1_9HYPO|nr:uncharacterized protein F5Z01DRAFT_649367 [Emericellopsis atlantica]KAG9256928.1 hypothetical protein F5Z01DRAFT_649367 [Emericellopsis atlantica]
MDDVTGLSPGLWGPTEFVVQPNCIGYRDQMGSEREIFVPQGALEAAWGYVENKDWDELAKYDTCVNQGYSDQDYVQVSVQFEDTSSGSEIENAKLET